MASIVFISVSVLEGSMAVAANKRSVMTLFSSASD
ncbi:MAG: stringent starvation protein A, partial [Vibrio sp.]|nr:stringent starvation protein A [Vibrio sp.]